MSILSDREYQCLGQWEEDGLLYTYTRRKDVMGFECFIGTYNEKGKLFLMEGGSDCKRGLRVTKYGMELEKRGTV